MLDRENPHPGEEAVVLIARTTQEAIIVNLDALSWSEVDHYKQAVAAPNGELRR